MVHKFPKPLIVWTTLGLIILQTFTHLEFKSPYLYYTKGNYNKVEKTYGDRLGPKGEVIHFDAINYWSVENLFSGKYRGEYLSTLIRPTYSWIASIFDNYLHKYHVGIFLNILFWWLAVLFGYALMFAIFPNQWTATLFSFLIASHPAFINTAGQPMGYILGYSLFVIVTACCFLKNSKDYENHNLALGVLFIVILSTFTYEILGPICIGIYLLTWGRKLKLWVTTSYVLIWIGSLLIWKFGFMEVLKSNTLAPVGIMGSQEAQFISKSLGPSTLSLLKNLTWGYLSTSFFWIPLISFLFFWLIPKKNWNTIFTIFTPITLTFFALWILSLKINGLDVLSEGRITAYYFLIPLLLFSLGIGKLLERIPISAGGMKGLQIGIVSFSLLIANLDLYHSPILYYIFNSRPMG